MDITKLRNNLKEKLRISGWDVILNEFIDSKSFETLMSEINRLHKEGNLTPSTKQIFRSFYECPYEKLSVLILGQDPYCEENEADGLAFSCGNSKKSTPILNVIFDEIKNTYYKDECWYAWEPDLTRWAKQGVLLLNASLTTEINKINMHPVIWKPFMEYLFNKLSKNDNIVYIFVGAVAKEWAKKIPESNQKLYCYHPASALYNDGIWESNDVFFRTNEILESYNKTKIIW